jgi:excisionase family DNA binding protein
MSKIFTIKEICGELKVSRKTVLHWIEAGELRAFKIGSGRRLWRICEQDLSRFIKAQIYYGKRKARKRGIK